MAQVDIIMPLYNKAGCVERAIRSIQAQALEDWRLIVVDDGSTDTGAQIVKAIQDERITIIHQENQGPGAARNKGIAQAEAEFLAFLDADDEWYPWYLVNALEAFKDEKLSMVSTMYQEWPQQIDMTKHWARRGVNFGTYVLKGDEDPQWAESLLLFLHVDATVLRLAVTRKYDGFYDEKRSVRGEDTVFFMRVGINEPFKIISPAAVRHHREDSGLSHTEDFPILPMLAEPDLLLRYCPKHKQEFALNIIECLALRTVHHWARNGLKSQAIKLLEQFPGAKRYQKMYRRCRWEIAFSKWLRHWVKFKKTIGPPVRRLIKIIAHKLGITERLPDIYA